jgi:hypothetical protein
VLAELQGEGADPHADASLRFTPVSFVSVGGAYAIRRADGSTLSSAARLEAAVRLWDTWLGGGVISRPAAALTPPTIYNSRYEAQGEGQATGAFATVRGRLWGPIYTDATGIRWQDGGGFYRPQYQTRSEVYIATTLPRRFPSGNFGLLASLRHEYRSDVVFPIAEEGTTGAVRGAGGYRVLSGLIEIRILQAVVSYQYRNMLIEDYATVPNYLMPRQTQFYGVRWEFWN